MRLLAPFANASHHAGIPRCIDTARSSGPGYRSLPGVLIVAYLLIIFGIQVGANSTRVRIPVRGPHTRYLLRSCRAQRRDSADVDASVSTLGASDWKGELVEHPANSPADYGLSGAVEQYDCDIPAGEDRARVGRISIVSPSVLFSDGLARLLHEHAELAPVPIQTYARDPLPESICWGNERGNNHMIATDSLVHIVLLHGAMKLDDLISWTRQVLQMESPAKVIVVELEHERNRILACIEAGVCGYTLIGASTADLVHVIQNAYIGIAECSPEITAAIFERLAFYGSERLFPIGADASNVNGRATHDATHDESPLRCLELRAKKASVGEKPAGGLVTPDVTPLTLVARLGNGNGVASVAAAECNRQQEDETAINWPVVPATPNTSVISKISYPVRTISDSPSDFPASSNSAYSAKQRAFISPHPRLTQRELQVLTLVAHERSNQEIAAELVIEVCTVKHHIHNILEKLGLRTRGEAASYALQRGLLHIPVCLSNAVVSDGSPLSAMD